MTTITVNSPVKVFAPRGAQLAGRLFASLLSWRSTVAQTHLDRRGLADRVAEASRVRSYAQQVMAQDPRFAADLFAAADRHEQD